MPILKKKIQLIKDFQDDEDDLDVIPEVKIESSTILTEETQSSYPTGVQEYILPMRKPRQKPPCPEGNSKNIVKNYGKALCSFASSKLAIPYLENIVVKKGYCQNVIQGFTAYIKSKKDAINSIDSLRGLLVGSEEDSEEMAIYKSLFQEVSVIFLKYFSVNWIFGGKLTHKTAHLKFRFKMLRRIQNPEHFTYLKTSAK